MQLKVPELVPFRLTQTLVSALGLAGGQAALLGTLTASHAVPPSACMPRSACMLGADMIHAPRAPPAGVEGGFRAGCERTLRVLRANSAPLRALLGAALRDPGVDWDAEPAAKAASKVGPECCSSALHWAGLNATAHGRETALS